MLSDLRYAARALRRTPGFAVVVVVTLMIGIASTTTIFSLVNTAMFRPLPYPAAARVHGIAEQERGHPSSFNTVSRRALNVIRTRASAFDRLTVYRDEQVLLTVGDVTTALVGIEADSTLLPLLGIRPELGRAFASSEFASAAPVAMVSDSLWRTLFAADSGMVGRSVRINGMFRTIVGVLPRGFRFPERSDVWFPLAVGSGGDPDDTYALLGRLAPGMSPEHAQRELAFIANTLRAGDPPESSQTLVLRDGMIDRGNAGVIGPIALIFLAAAACVLLVACTNVGNLLQIRAAERRTEWAVRTALGATGSRLMRQSLVESLVLGTAGGVAGVAASWWAVRLLLHTVPTYGFPSWLRFGIDVRVLLFALALSLVATLAFGMAPARIARHVDLADDLKVGSGSTRGHAVVRRGHRGVVTQLALAFVLCAAAAMLLKTYLQLNSIDPGYRTADVWSLMPMVDRERYADDRKETAFVHGVAAELSRNRSVASVVIRGDVSSTVFDTSTALTHTDSVDRYFLFLPSNATRALDRDVATHVRRFAVSPGYFSMLGLPLLEGRGFLAADRAGSPPVAVVGRQFARAVWHTEQVLGRTIQIGPHGTQITVVGVVQDPQPIRLGTSDATATAVPTLYLSDQQAFSGSPEILIRARDGVLSRQLVSTALHRVDPDAGIGRLETLADQLRVDTLPVRLIGALVGTFAACAFGLAMLGIYGVIGYGVVQRTREIGIRLALGGTTSRIVGAVVYQGLRLVAIGLLIGVIVALGIGRVIASLRFDVTVFDPLAFSAAAAVFAVIGALGCYLPARRVSRVSPQDALRAE